MTPLPASTLFDHFAALPDPRVERTKEHQLLDILTIAICAITCGADSFVEMEEFGALGLLLSIAVIALVALPAARRTHG